MVYNWDDKYADCYRLYVEERRSLDEVVSVWRGRGFGASKRAFQTQFKRWDFPSKQNPAHKNAALLARVRALWETNAGQKEMLSVLRSEGFEISDRELVRVRGRCGLFMRERRGRSGEGVKGVVVERIVREGMESCGSGEEEEEGEGEMLDDGGEGEQANGEDLDPDEFARRELRIQQLQAESEEKWRTRKRRRRTRGWAGLPPDAPGEPPRFPSETTIDESKAYLKLDNALYRQVRSVFQDICQEESVIKKTIAGPEKWSQVKHRLVERNAHLAGIFSADPEAKQQIGTMPTPSNFKALSLDVICTDVTKRMRVMSTRMSMAEAKNILGLNPTESREARKALAAILRADHFTNKHESGDEHWNALKERWIRESERLTEVLSIPQSDQRHAEKVKAVEVVARDTMKRLRTERNTRDPSLKKQINVGPGPGPAYVRAEERRRSEKSSSVDAGRAPTVDRVGEQNTGPDAQLQALDISALAAASDLQIDPSLLLAASESSMVTHEAQQGYRDTQIPAAHTQQTSPATTTYMPPTHSQPHPQIQTQPPSSIPLPLPIYFRLHPSSSTTHPQKTLWLSILQTGTLAELRTLATREHPGTVVVRIEGVVVHRMDGNGGERKEVRFGIDEEGELGAYLELVCGSPGEGERERKAVFVVLLGRG